MPTASPETIRQWAELLHEEARVFSIRKSPQRARNMLTLCACVESALTAYLIKQKMEGIVHGE